MSPLGPRPIDGGRLTEQGTGTVGSSPRIAVDDPRRADVHDLLERHRAFSVGHSKPEDVHALGPDALIDEAITVYSARDGDGALLGVGALRELDRDHGELKSMHTVEGARRRGVGRAMVAHLLGVARRRGYRRLSLETGAQAAFAPARSLYGTFGFERCATFGDYPESPHSVCMALSLHAQEGAGEPAAGPGGRRVAGAGERDRPRPCPAVTGAGA